MADYILRHSGSEIDSAVDKIKNLDNVGSGADGREVELQTNSTHIQWRYSGESEWRNLIELKRLEGPQGPIGATGATGPQGPIGATGQNAVNPNFSIGTVTTLPSGSDTTVTLTGTYPNLVLNFGIPGGADGVNISQEDIKAAVNDYLEKNPVQSGATAEQAAQIQANKTAIGDSSSGLIKEVNDIKNTELQNLNTAILGVNETLGDKSGLPSGDANVIASINRIDSKTSTGTGLTSEQISQLQTAYLHSQSTHVQAGDIPTKTSDLTNDSGFLTSIPSEYITDSEMSSALSTKANTSDIPSLEGYATESYVTTKIAEASLSGGEVDLSGYAKVTDLPTKTSQLTNDSGFITAIPSEYVTDAEVGTAVSSYVTEHKSELKGDQGEKGDTGAKGDKGDTGPKGQDGLTTSIRVGEQTFTQNEGLITLTGIATENFVTTKISEAQLSGGTGSVDLSTYATKEELNNKADKTAIPTKTSQLTNDSGYLKSTDTIDADSLNGKKISEPMTKAEYDAIVDKDPNTIYLVDEDTVIEGIPSYSITEANKVLAVNSDGTALAWMKLPNNTSDTLIFEDVSNDEVFMIIEATLSSISAVYTQGDTVVYPNTSLDNLKSNLVVTATYSDNNTNTITDYVLSGTLTVGTSTITVTYNDKTTTFNVTVSEEPTTYTITNTLTNVTNSNLADNVIENSSYSATLSPNIGYTIGDVTITMGDIDITSTVYNNGNISIENVTGNIIITATGIAKTLSSISAVYTQGDTVVYPSTSLDSLKSNLVVTANYSDDSTNNVTDYTLSGALTVGTSTITVNYNGKTTTFDVTVSEESENTITIGTVEERYINGNRYIGFNWEFEKANEGDRNIALFEKIDESVNFSSYRFNRSLEKLFDFSDKDFVKINNCYFCDEPGNYNSTFMNETKTPNESYIYRNSASLYVKVRKENISNISFEQYALNTFGKIYVKDTKMQEWTLDPSNIISYTAAPYTSDNMLEYSLYNITINDSDSIVESTAKGLNSFGYFNTDAPLYLHDTQPLARKVSNNFMISLPNSANINSLEDLRSYFTTNIFKSYTLK